MLFLNRKTAGIQLAQKLNHYKRSGAIVLALPRGGVPVASQVADWLELPMDVLVTRKITSPSFPELALGAVCEQGEPYWNHDLLTEMGLSPQDLRGELEQQQERIKYQVYKFRQGHVLRSLKGKTVIVIDDGIATGATMRAAIEFLKGQDLASLVVATPVAAEESVNRLASLVDEVVVVHKMQKFSSVGQWYKNFTQVEDQNVVDILSARSAEEVRHTGERVKIMLEPFHLRGEFFDIQDPRGLVVFVHGSGSDYSSPRNRYLSTQLQEAGYSTLLFDLLTHEEAGDRRNTFDIVLLTQRLSQVIQWISAHKKYRALPLVLFAASTGAAAALSVVPQFENKSQLSVICRGGRPDLATVDLRSIEVPVLLIVGGYDADVLKINQRAADDLPHSELLIVPQATHLFEEAGALEQVGALSVNWLTKTLIESPLASRRNNGVSQFEQMSRRV